MKPEDISDAIGMLDDKLIASAENARKKRHKTVYISYAVTIAVFLLCCFAIPFIFQYLKTTKPINAYEISKAIYPTTALYPNNIKNKDKQYKEWQKDQEKQSIYISSARNHIKNLTEFFMETIQQVLTNEKKSSYPLASFFTSSDDKNYICSPFNIYMALSILSELCDGNSQKQILDLLKIDTIKELRSQTDCLWNAEYCNDGVTINTMGNSLWLHEPIPFCQSLLDTIANQYYTSSYQGTMGSKKLNQILQDWINEQTNNLLNQNTQTIQLTKDTILALISTVYFQSAFKEEFSESATEEAIFHTPNKDITCNFMHQDNYQDYYESESFLAVKKYLQGNQSLWLFLPKHKENIQDLLKDSSILNLILYETEIPLEKEQKEEDIKKQKQEIINIERKTALIHLSLPKFDISSNFDLAESLQAMGITDIFDQKKADFSPLIEHSANITSQGNIYLSKASHAARLMLDEEGILAAAYTEMELYYGYTCQKQESDIEIIFDRPFFFIIAGKANTPLFAGIVNNPNKTINK